MTTYLSNLKKKFEEIIDEKSSEIKKEDLDKKFISVIVDEFIKDLDNPTVSEKSIYQKISGKL